MAVRHAFESAVVDAADPDVVGPDEWNEPHVVTGDFLNSRKAAADTPDDEFETGTLDAKWDPVNGTSGTVNLLESGNVGRYDLTTRPGELLIQVGTAITQRVHLRQDYTLPDGASIVAAVTPAINFGTLTADELQFAIVLNQSDSDYSANPTLTFYGVEVDATSPDTQTVILGNSAGQASLTLASTQRTPAYGETIFLRIARAGLSYYPMISYDGRAWAQFGATTYASALTNLWIVCQNPGATGTPVPIQSVRWVRQGTNDLDPWPWW